MQRLLQILEDYSHELGINHLSLESLVCSHRALRNDALKTNEEKRKEMERLRKVVQEQAMDETWIKIEDLKSMTLRELSDLIGPD